MRCVEDVVFCETDSSIHMHPHRRAPCPVQAERGSKRKEKTHNPELVG